MESKVRSPLLKRLPLLLLAALGIWLYQSGLFTQDRTLVWQTGGTRSEIRRVELQIWDRGGELRKRTLLEYPQGAPADIIEKVSLGRGSYDARYVIDRAAAPQEAGERELVVTTEETYWLPLGHE